MTSDTPQILEKGVATLSEKIWEQARRRRETLGLWLSLMS